MKMKRNVELVSGHVFHKACLEISVVAKDGRRLWFVCQNKKDFDAIYEFLKIEEEIKK